jgi:hypothetical protein
MEEFFSPSTRLELLRFRNWKALFAEIAEGAYGAETDATSVRTARSPDLVFDIAAGQSRPAGPPLL